MADLLSVLSGAQTSLAAQRAVQATAGHNIENASTPGYARQRANLEAVAPGDSVRGLFIGNGATVTSITQSRDRFVEAQVPRALAAAASSTAESDALGAIHALDPGAAGGLGDALAAFYSGLRAVAQSPSNPSLRTAAIGAASGLAASFTRTRGALEDARSGIDASLAGVVSEANGEAAAVADLNGRIRVAGAGGAAPNDLLDLRQQHVDRLAELTGATPIATSDGDVNLALAGGAALVSGSTAGTLSLLPQQGGHPSLQLAPPGGGGPAALATAPGGQAGGLLAARDVTLASAVTGLDDLANDLATAVNDAHASGVDAQGAQGGPFFTVGATGGAAATITVAVDAAHLATGTLAGSPYSNNVQALVATEDAALGASGQDAAATLSTITAGFGASASRAEATAAQDGALKDHLSSLRDSVSGVSIDEEMIQMQQAQRSYEAITQVIQVADSMMDTLMKLR
jgi:flagellar hook-associated protein 1